MNTDSLVRLVKLVENLRQMSVEVQLEHSDRDVWVRVLHRYHDVTQKVTAEGDTDSLAAICDAIGSMVFRMIDSGAK